ncbi:hypothetical protein N7463_006224 [Penicillium fimorum]|uniref:Uncharacterized protein n=1 Tax=Penicillium fimorum TaxID=1882269 RepID=A0A9W9XTY7_9EURO|nr:hypothetical protein N7463_006224 [Penicillium fimorum]
MYQYFQPVRIFSQLHQQYDFIWQFEMDARYTGHLYHLLEQAAAFAKQQPRKHLWERNSYFYIPTVHGTWEEFNSMVDRWMVDRATVWGPVPVEDLNVSAEAHFLPPILTAEKDISSWGIGEEADVITWLPQFNPANTGWPMRDVIYGFAEGPAIPRRSSPVAMSRLSARVLRIMHTDLAEKGLDLGSEMSPTSIPCTRMGPSGVEPPCKFR